MSKASANLRISYLGGGYDFPKFFEYREVSILAEGLPVTVDCYVSEKGVNWVAPVLSTGLGSSAARHLSFIRAMFPEAPFRDQIDAAIQLDALQAGGWQDTIAAAYQGLIKIVFSKNDWSVYPLTTKTCLLLRYRKLYFIPVVTAEKGILTAMRCRESSFENMQALVAHGEAALKDGDVQAFGKAVGDAWRIKKQWHPDISNYVIHQMEHEAELAGAWGYKVCGAGGQGYFLVIGNEKCHRQMQKRYKPYEYLHC